MTKNSEKKNLARSFAHHLNTEKIKEFRSMSAKAKLEWLEEAHSFVRKFLDKKKRIRWDERLQ